MKSLSFALVLSLGLSSIGCAATEPAASEDADLKAATTLTEKDDGRTVSYNEGQSVIVALAILASGFGVPGAQLLLLVVLPPLLTQGRQRKFQ